MTTKECKGCNEVKDYTEYYVLKDGTHTTKCRECLREYERKKRYSKNPNIIPRKRKKYLVRGHWLGAIITLSNRKLETRKVTEADVEQLKKEGFGFILKNGV